MTINIIAVGRVKEDFFRSAIGEYTKRLGRYCRLNIIEVADEKTDEDLSPAEKDNILKKEAARIISKLPESTYVITLEIKGRQYSSEDLADEIAELTNRGNSAITFIIGGSLGLHNDVISRADAHLSFSKMTFPHQLMRIILLEQIYRSFRIINHEPYHK